MPTVNIFHQTNVELLLTQVYRQGGPPTGPRPLEELQGYGQLLLGYIEHSQAATCVLTSIFCLETGLEPNFTEAGNRKI
jgi:hypothetical protein